MKAGISSLKVNSRGSTQQRNCPGDSWLMVNSPSQKDPSACGAKMKQFFGINQANFD